ncbi:MAG TPA: gamma-glutamyltransferase [Flavitalea sp.]|nr:gamma-glutamyltransferase [Flavitalea sp.]
MKKIRLLVVVAVGACMACKTQKTSQVHEDYHLKANPYNYSITKNLSPSKAAVVSAHPLASEVGLQVMQMGGNAVDAAIATQYALAVVYPGAGNLGGGGFMVARLANGKTISIDYREKAPSGASKDMYLDSSGNAMTDKSQNGHLAAGVPGTVAGLFASAKYGRLPMSALIQPAIDLAEKGFVLTASEAESLNNTKEEFLKFNTVLPVFVNSRPWKKGDTLVQKELAATLSRIRDGGRKEFYEGKTAKLVEAEMKRGNGLITRKDMKQYRAKERDAVVFDYKGYTIITMPLPSSGGILLPQMLKMVEDKPLGKYGFHSWQAIQLMTEVERRAYADRATYLGDPDFYKIPVKTLTSKEYLAERMKDYDPLKAGNSKNTGAGTIAESKETTHLSVIDSAGNAVAVTTTLNGGYGSRTVVAGAGFLLNNEMDDFSIKPGVANMYGALGAEANSIRPGKRMLSSMSPTIVLRGGKPFMVVGTPGGTTIPTSVFQSIVNVIDFGMNAEDAVNKPKFHHQWQPDTILIEKGFPADVLEKLKSIGYKISAPEQIGRTELILIKENGKIEAAADGRGNDSVAGE